MNNTDDDGFQHIRPRTGRDTMEINSVQPEVAGSAIRFEGLKSNQFRVDAVPPGSALRIGDVAVFNVGGSFCATQAKCTHRQGPLSEGPLDGSTVTCPYHGSQFNVCTGAVLRGPAADPLRTYRVVVKDDIGQVEAG